MQKFSKQPKKTPRFVPQPCFNTCLVLHTHFVLDYFCFHFANFLRFASSLQLRIQFTFFSIHSVCFGCFTFHVFCLYCIWCGVLMIHWIGNEGWGIEIGNGNGEWLVREVFAVSMCVCPLGVAFVRTAIAQEFRLGGCLFIPLSSFSFIVSRGNGWAGTDALKCLWCGYLLVAARYEKTRLERLISIFLFWM